MDSLKVGSKILELNDRLEKLINEMLDIRTELIDLTDNLIDDTKNETQLNKGGIDLVLNGRFIKFPKLEVFCLKHNINWKIDNIEDICNDIFVTFLFVKDGCESVVRRYIINSKSDSILVGNRLINDLCEMGFDIGY